MKHTISILALASVLSACGDQYANTLAAAKESPDRNLPSHSELKEQRADVIEEDAAANRTPVDPHDIDTRPTNPVGTDATFQVADVGKIDMDAQTSEPSGKDQDSAGSSDSLLPPGEVPAPPVDPNAPMDPSAKKTEVAQTPDANGTDASKNPNLKKDDAAKLGSMDGEFIQKAAVSGLYEVEASELAILQATTPEMRDFAQLMVDDHGDALRSLEDLARKKGAAIPKETDTEHQSRISSLRDMHGLEFDREYRAQQITAHKDAIALFERAASKCEDADLKALAEKLLPTLRDHEEKLNAIPPTEG